MRTIDEVGPEAPELLRYLETKVGVLGLGIVEPAELQLGDEQGGQQECRRAD
jgi:hypothetical protein